MKPKDLLKFLEKGDRTMEHLSQSAAKTLGVSSTPDVSTLAGMISQAYGGSIQGISVSQAVDNTSQQSAGWAQQYTGGYISSQQMNSTLSGWNRQR